MRRLWFIVRGWFPGAVVGVLAAAAGLASGQFLAALVQRPEASPLITVGGIIVDATPTPLKEFAVREFGTNDKLVLLLSIGAGLAAIAAILGILAAGPGRRRMLGLIGAGLFGALGVVAAATRPANHPVDLLPAMLAGIVAVLALRLLAGALDRRAAGRLPGGGEDPGRRALLRTGAVVAAGSAVLGGAGLGLNRYRSASAARNRASVRLPAPQSIAGARNPGAGFYTPNSDFYRVDTALVVPRIDPDGWRLRVRGLVDRELSISLERLLAYPMIERDITLNCVSNEVGGPYIGTARWLGVPLKTILDEAGLQPAADQIVARGSEGMTIGTPVKVALDGRDTMLAVGMNGEPLPLEHGFPVRMLTPGLYGYVGSCKWLVDLELTTFDAYDPYWVQRGWAAQAPVKTASRIDKPASFAKLAKGTVMVAGVAWAQHRGIEAVEVQVDGGGWEAARLEPVQSIDTWVQWTYAWPATSGAHTLRVRATDGTGAVQTAERAAPFPDGASGWQSVAVAVT